MKGKSVYRRLRFASALVLLGVWFHGVRMVSAQQYASLHAAAEAGDTQAINAILDEGQDINSRDNRGYTPLLAAAVGGHTEAIELILSKGGDIGAVDNAGNTAIHLATAYGHTAACRLLLQRGASPQTRNYAGLSPLEIARNAQRPELIALLEPVTEQQFAGETGLQDPNQIWRATALKVLADPNGLAGSLSRHKDIYDAIRGLAASARQEVMAWVQPSPTQASRLQRAVQMQITAELDFIRKTADKEGAKATAADANQLIAVWEQRLKMVADRMREQRRQEMAQMRGRPVTPRPVVTQPLALPPLLPPILDGPNVPKPDSYFAPNRLRSDGERLAQVWASPSQDIQQLATEVNDLNMRDLGYLRTVASREKASERTLAAIDGVIAMRAQRHTAILQTRQPVQQMDQPTGQGGWRRQMP